MRSVNGQVSPLSLSGEEVMPLDYRAGDSGWLLYGRELDKKRISEFQHKLGVAIAGGFFMAY